MTGPDPALAPLPPVPFPRRRALLLALVAGLVAGPAAAQGRCEEAVTQADLNDCAALAYEAADTELNSAYDAALETAGRYGSLAEESLRAAQRNWIAFRDAACESEAVLWDGGSAQPMIRSGCLERLTAQRTEDLWDYAEN